MKTIDARGLECPRPVILTKQELDTGAQQVAVLVDNETAVENVGKLAAANGYTVAKQEQDGAFLLTLSKSGEAKAEEKAASDRWMLFVTDETIGQGEGELGGNLMKMFFYTLCETNNTPSVIALMNGGVKLATLREQVIEHLKTLQARGSRILVCGTCLNFYGIADQLQVGNVSNMYEISEAMLGSPRVIKL